MIASPSPRIHNSSSLRKFATALSIQTMAESLGDGLAKGTAPPPRKKSLFSKSWAKPVEQKEGIDFFSRADELWPSRLAEEERRRQKKAVKLEQKRSTASAERKSSSTPDGKRRRVSQNEEHGRHSSEGSLNHADPDEASWTRRQVTSIAYSDCILTVPRESTLSTPGSRKSNSSSRRKPQAPPVSLGERYSRDLHTKGTKASNSEIAAKGYISLSDSDNGVEDAPQQISYGATGPINLDDDDDDVIAIASQPAVRIEEDPDMSDEEFPELARRARQREKEKALERARAKHSFENKNHDTTGSDMLYDVFDDVFEERPVISEDPVIEILVTSWIEGTDPLMVRRKLSQKLKEVRLIWCDKQSISGQPLPKSIKDSIFLTWKGLKLYDFTSCKSLGLKIDGNGDLVSTGEGFMKRDDGTKVHFEAWTPELYEQNQRKLKAKRDRGDSDDELEEVVVEQKIKLIMKAKDMEPVKLQVTPRTTISKMAAAFRVQRNVPQGKEVALYFDGDKLNPESTVTDVDLEPMDNVEVHIQ